MSYAYNKRKKAKLAKDDKRRKKRNKGKAERKTNK